METGNNALQVAAEDTSPAVFDTKEPGAVITKATGIANQLAPLVERAKLFSVISGRKYVKVEGWSTMLSMLGIFPQVEYCRRVFEDAPGTTRTDVAYEARVILKTITGQTVGAGEALCSSRERNWSNRDEFALKSMAQTRATGKAARVGFAWIMALAGFEATPAEEMAGDEHEQRTAVKPHTPVKSNPAPLPDVVKDAHENGENLLTSSFEVSEPIESRNNKGSFYRRAVDREGVGYYIHSDRVIADLSVAGDRPVTVKLKRDGKFVSIVEVLPS